SRLLLCTRILYGGWAPLRPLRTGKRRIRYEIFQHLRAGCLPSSSGSLGTFPDTCRAESEPADQPPWSLLHVRYVLHGCWAEWGSEQLESSDPEVERHQLVGNLGPTP